jgi:hypothetical protein
MYNQLGRRRSAAQIITHRLLLYRKAKSEPIRDAYYSTLLAVGPGVDCTQNILSRIADKFQIACHRFKTIYKLLANQKIRLSQLS